MSYALLKNFLCSIKYDANFIMALRYSNRAAFFKLKPLQEITSSTVEESQSSNVDSFLKFTLDKRIIYNCYLDQHKVKVPKYIARKVKDDILKSKENERYISSSPLIVEKLMRKKLSPLKIEENTAELNVEQSNPESFPFGRFANLEFKYDGCEIQEDGGIERDYSESFTTIQEDIDVRLMTYNEKIKYQSSFPQVSENKDPELEVRVYEDTLLSDITSGESELEVEVTGSPDPKVPRSSVPCGGCGAFLHCQDEGIPGKLSFIAFVPQLSLIH